MSEEGFYSFEENPKNSTSNSSLSPSSLSPSDVLHRRNSRSMTVDSSSLSRTSEDKKEEKKEEKKENFFSKFFYRTSSKDKEKDKKEEKNGTDRKSKFQKSKAKSVVFESQKSPKENSSFSKRNSTSPPSSPSFSRHSGDESSTKTKEEKKEEKNQLKISSKLQKVEFSNPSKSEEKSVPSKSEDDKRVIVISPSGRRKTQRAETSVQLLSTSNSKFEFRGLDKNLPTVSASDPFIAKEETNSVHLDTNLSRELEKSPSQLNKKHGIRRIMSDDTNWRALNRQDENEDKFSQSSLVLVALKDSKTSKKLELSSLNLIEIPKETFDLIFLVDLNLSNNKLTQISPLIKGLINLKSLNLSSNQLTFLPSEIGTLKSLTDLKISFNPLPPDIKLAHWRGTLKDLLFKNYQAKKKDMINASPVPGKVSQTISDWTKSRQLLHAPSMSSFMFTTKTEKIKTSKLILDKLKLWEKQLPFISVGEELNKKNSSSSNENPLSSSANFPNNPQNTPNNPLSLSSNEISNNSNQSNANANANNSRENLKSSRNLNSNLRRNDVNNNSNNNNNPSLLRSPLRSALRILSNAGTSLNLMGNSKENSNSSNFSSTNNSDNSDSESLGSSSDDTTSIDSSMRNAGNAALEWKDENTSKLLSSTLDVEILGVVEVPLAVRAISVGKNEKNGWLEQLVPLSESCHENVNPVVAIMKLNRKRMKFRGSGGEPNWVNEMLSRSSDEPFLVFSEKSSGVNLKEWNSSHSAQVFLMKKRMQVAQQIALGMQFLHSKGIIHHNLKLSNVISFEQKIMKVTDYFLGNRLLKDYTEELIQLNDRKKSNPSTPNSETPATIPSVSHLPYWMAPEILENEEYDEKIDVYSFGMLLIELLSNKVPFDHLKTIEELVQIVCIQSEKPALSKIPPSVSSLIDRCLKKKASERPSFSQILEGFEVYLIESVCEDPIAAKFWISEFRMVDSVQCKEFLTAFFAYFKVPPSISKDPILIDALRGVLVDSDEAVTMESFSKMTQWFGPLDGVEMLTRMVKLHSEPWFYGNLSSIQAEDALADKGRGTFLIRFSSSNPGSFAVSVNSEEGPVKHYKIWHQPGEGYSLGKEEFKDFESLIANRRDLLFLKVPCSKGDKYSDSNFWATQEISEGMEGLKTVVSLKKLCFRHIYRKAHLYPNLDTVLPSDLLEEYRCTIIDSATSDETGRNIWKDCWLLQDSVPFDQFTSALCVFLNTTLVPSSQNYNCLRAIIQDIDDANSDSVSTETFSKLLEWFGPLDSHFLEKISDIITKPWFHGNMSHQQAEKHVQKHNAKKGTFLIRFSSKNRGYFTITVLGRSRSLLHYRVYYNRQEVKYVIGKRSFNSLDDIIKDYHRELYLKSPCPGSKFSLLHFDPFLMDNQPTSINNS